MLRIFDAAELGKAQIGAFADYFGAEFGAIDPHGVIAAIADIEIALAGGLDEGADATEPEQIDFGFERES